MNDHAVDPASTLTTPRRPLASILLLAGALGLAWLAAWLPWLSRQNGHFVLASDKWTAATLPTWAIFLCAGSAALAALTALWSLRTDPRVRAAAAALTSWTRRHPALTLLVLLLSLAGAVDIYELLYDPFLQKWGPDGHGGLRKWMLREDLQVWLLWSAALLAGLAFSAWCPLTATCAPRLRAWRTALRAAPLRRRLTLLTFLVPLLLGAVMCLFALEGIPHFSDALTYLMQGRMYWRGMLFVPAPADVDLFQHSLFVLAKDGRMFGKYPIGWPLIVGAFDKAHLLFLANATLAGLVCVLTSLAARHVLPRRPALLAGLLMALSPWLWFHGASFASHVASTCAITGFLWCFLAAHRRSTKSKIQNPTASTSAKPAKSAIPPALGAAFFILLGVLVRPQDMFLFALPAMATLAWQLLRTPRRALPIAIIIGLGGALGVGLMLWVNAHTTGNPFLSPYKLEGRWDKDWNATPLSMLARFAFQWTELNGRFPGWGVGSLTIAALGLLLARRLWHTTGLRILLAGWVLFFCFCTAFGFTNVWWGPRWLLPAAPLLAMLAATVVDRLLTTASRRHHPDSHRSALAAQLALCILLGGITIGILGRYPGQFHLHRVMPPHTVSAAAHLRAQAMQLHHAIIAMPLQGDRPPRDARAGIVFMSVPFERNDVIYVRAVPDWQTKAQRSFPGRALYQLLPSDTDPQGFTIQPVNAR